MATGGCLPCASLGHSCNPPDCVFHEYFSEPDLVACVRPVCKFVYGNSVEAMKSVLGRVHVQGYRDWLLLRRKEADMYKASRIDGPMGVIRELQEENERLKKEIQMHLAFRDRIDSLRKGRYTESPLPKSKKDRRKKKGSTGASAGAGTGTSASASDGRNSGESDADDDDNQSNAVENLGNYSSIGLQQQINELPINDPEASPSLPTNEIAGDASRSPSPSHPTTCDLGSSRSPLGDDDQVLDDFVDYGYDGSTVFYSSYDDDDNSNDNADDHHDDNHDADEVPILVNQYEGDDLQDLHEVPILFNQGLNQGNAVEVAGLHGHNLPGSPILPDPVQVIAQPGNANEGAGLHGHILPEGPILPGPILPDPVQVVAQPASRFVRVLARANAPMLANRLRTRQPPVHVTSHQQAEPRSPIRQKRCHLGCDCECQTCFCHGLPYRSPRAAPP